MTKIRIITFSLIAAIVLLFYTVNLSSCSRGSDDLNIVSSFSSCQRIVENKYSEDIDYSKLEANYKNMQTYVFDQHCNSCHFAEGDFPNLNSFNEVVSFIDRDNLEESPLLKIIEEGVMPPSASPGQIFNQDVYSYIKKWVLLGAPEGDL